MKTISILGSTGSIGTQALTVIRRLGYTVSALSAYKNIDLLEQQIREFKPKLVSVYSEPLAKKLKENIKDTSTKVLCGQEGNCAVATHSAADIVLTSMVGMIGLVPTLAAIEAGKDIALANKETLVCAGQLIMQKAKEKGIRIYPVDSEHSAIFQCLQQNVHNNIENILLTASGGPFRGFTKEQLRTVTKEQALRHPNWTMGAKITIDSATMMNKGLEVMEAKWLFDVAPERIKIVVHPESIVHSMVEFEDHAVLAQMGVPSMEIPIQYAFTYPYRVSAPQETLGLDLYGKALHFESVDTEVFKCPDVCRKALTKGGLYPVAVNGANEQAVALFLNDRIAFWEIGEIVEQCFHTFSSDVTEYTLQDVLDADAWARNFVNSTFGREELCKQS